MYTTFPFFKPFRRSLLTAGFLLLFSGPGWPVTLELRTGQTISGTIIQKDEDSYKLDTGIGFPVTYFIDEIKAIDGKPISPPAEASLEEETSLEPAETENEAPVLPPEQQAPVAVESVMDLQTTPVTAPNTAVAPETETKEVPTAEETPDTVQLEDVVVGETEPQEATPRPMAQIIADEINQMMIKNNAANEPVTPVLRNGPETGPREEPAKDIPEIEAGLPLKESPSPFGPTVKPREPQPQATASDLATGKREEHQLMAEVMEAPEMGHPAAPASIVAGGNSNAIFRAFNDYIYMQKLRLHFAKANLQDKLPYIKEKLYQLPLHVRKDALVVILCVLAVMYIVVCYPLMNIARKLGKKHSWLIWIPFAQLVYFIHIAGKPLWWAVFWVVPGVNYFLLLLLFVDILRAMKKSFWLIILIIIPGVNIFALWYLAISQEFQITDKEAETITPVLR